MTLCHVFSISSSFMSSFSTGNLGLRSVEVVIELSKECQELANIIIVRPKPTIGSVDLASFLML
jgi:hypothetical protein